MEDEIITSGFGQISTKTIVRSFLLLLAAIGCIVSYKWKNKEYFKKLNEFSSLPTLPLIGSSHLILGKTKSRVKKLLSIICTYYNNTPFIFWFSYYPFICVTKYEDIQVVSNKSLERYSMGIFQKVLGEGILISPPNVWRKNRHLINPAFALKFLEQYLKVFNENSKMLISNMKSNAEKGNTFDVEPYITTMNLHSIVENMCGLQLQNGDKESDDFAKALAEYLALETTRFYDIWLFPKLVFESYLLFTGKIQVYRKIFAFATKVIRSKTEEYVLSKKNGTENNESMKTLLDVLIRDRETNPDFTDSNLRSEFITMIITGLETSATAVCFVLLMFAIHQDEQEKAYQEICSVVENTENKFISMNILKKLTYLEQCIKETLRRFTIVPIMFRKTTDDVVLNDKRIIPKNCVTLLCLYALHLNPEIFPNPYTWNPDNFAAGKNGNNNFIPFGTGPRTCIGSKYSMISMKTQVAHVLQNYQLFTNLKMSDIRLTLNITISSKNGYPIRIIRRKNFNYRSL